MAAAVTHVNMHIDMHIWARSLTRSREPHAAAPLTQALAWHEAHRTRHVREARAIELRTNAAVKRGAREGQRARLGRVKDEAAERRHRVRARAVRADELQVDRLREGGDERVVAGNRHDAPAGRAYTAPPPSRARRSVPPRGSRTASTPG